MWLWSDSPDQDLLIALDGISLIFKFHLCYWQYKLNSDRKSVPWLLVKYLRGEKTIGQPWFFRCHLINFQLIINFWWIFVPPPPPFSFFLFHYYSVPVFITGLELDMEFFNIRLLTVLRGLAANAVSLKFKLATSSLFGWFFGGWVGLIRIQISSRK